MTHHLACEAATLDALASRVDDPDGDFPNRGEPVPEGVDRGLLGKILLAARIYEWRRPVALNPTSVSLLDRLKVARPDASDWGRLQEVYRPLIRRWLGRVPGLGAEADDLAQEVLVVVVREIPRFDRRREGSFRAWLRQVTINKVRTYRRQRHRRPAVALDPADGFLERLSDPNGDLAREWDRDHDKHVVDRLLATVQPDFRPTTWEAFRRFAVDGEPARRVADDLGLTENAVLLAKSRVLKRLREEAGDLLG